MREELLLCILLLCGCCAFTLTVYEPYERQTNVYTDGKQTVELTIENLSYRDDESEEYFEQEIAETNKDNGIQKLEENQNSYAHSIEEETELNTDDEIEVDPLNQIFRKAALDIPDPPSHKETAKMSRYLCHYSDYLAMATISTRGSLTGTPFASIFSYADGTMDKSTGVPYFYLTNMDMSTHDLQKNPKASVTISLAQSGYCLAHDLDPEDPRCAHVILAGDVLKVDNKSTEEEFAKEALFTRHPAMTDWPVDHGWYFAKLNITNVILLDFFGGAIDVPLQEYFDVAL